MLHETMVIRTLNIRQQGTMISERQKHIRSALTLLNLILLKELPGCNMKKVKLGKTCGFHELTRLSESPMRPS